jgi:hypothetical protein
VENSTCGNNSTKIPTKRYPAQQIAVIDELTNRSRTKDACKEIQESREKGLNLAATRARAPAVGTALDAGPRRLRPPIGRSRTSSTRPSSRHRLLLLLPSPHPVHLELLFYLLSEVKSGGGWLHTPNSARVGPSADSAGLIATARGSTGPGRGAPAVENVALCGERICPYGVCRGGDSVSATACYGLYCTMSMTLNASLYGSE